MGRPWKRRSLLMRKLVQKFLSDERGLETVEYAIIAGLIVIGTIVAIGSIGTWVADKFDTLDSTLETSTGGAAS